MIYLILPSFNEKKNLIKIFKKINNLNEAKKFIVVVVDDCSTDDTKDLRKNKNKFRLIYKRHILNKGLSITLETGFKTIIKKIREKDFIITMDGDNTHPIKIIPKMIDKMKKNKLDIVIASRFTPSSKVNGLSVPRRLLSLLAKYIFSLFFSYRGLNEYTCNFRVYKPHLIRKILKNKNFFKNEDFNIAVKILLHLIYNSKKIKISEFPLILNYHYKIGSSKMRIFKNVFLTLKLIFFKRFNS
jgi:dolichol-phosphate mannosyltransferase